jgi:hypothetical protein
MNRENAIRIAAALPEGAKVLDVGGGAAPFPRATHVLDGLAFDEGSCQEQKLLEDAIPTQFTRDTWYQTDACDHKPWPYPDKYFDYVTCSHLLEDVRDPIWICSEIQRVAKAGYIEVPSRILEQSLGIENPTYAGYHHHHWLVEIRGNCVEFLFKPHNLHSLKSAIVTRISATQRMSPRYDIQFLEWSGHFEYTELLIFSESEIERNLTEFAVRSRSLPALVVKREDSLKGSARRLAYYERLRMGRR